MLVASVRCSARRRSTSSTCRSTRSARSSCSRSGVSLILFYGGLNLSLPVLRRVWIGLGMLVVPGVVLTAAVMGVAAHLAFDLSWTAALLMGAVLVAHRPGDPDPAVRALAAAAEGRPDGGRRVGLQRPHRRGSGAGARRRPAERRATRVTDPAGEFLVDLAISTVIGIVAGVVLAAAISSRRSGIWRESSALAVLAVVTISFFSLDSPAAAATWARSWRG